ncbi:MAG: trypsin-like peptidase domain-containing protein [Actinobacteria bacterium]|nr:trypsin-like peptidase domain-containing protein [Actinomycetota bacterium]
MFRKFLVFFLSIVAASAIGAGAGIGIWEATDDDGAATVVQTAPTRSVAAGAQLSVNEIYQRAKDGVVLVTTSTQAQVAPFLPPGQGGGTSTGSGFVIDDEGHVLTNQHVVDNAQSVTVRFPDGDEIDARVVGADASSDVAVLELDSVPSGVTPVELGSSESLEIGDLVVAIGSPFGLEGTVTSGIVSALHRELTAPDGFTIDGAIQTDAAINPGNSGGPLLDGQGRVVGINSQIASSSGGNEGIGYAVPIEIAKEVADALIAGRSIERPFLGVQLAEADEGAQIAAVTDGSPADRAGLKQGDVITEVEGEAASADDVRRAVAARKPGDELELTIRRGGGTQTVTATLGKRPTQSD